MNNQLKKSFPLRKLTVAAVFAALITILTTISIPIPGGHGYVHLGDSMIYACAWAVGGPIGGVAAAIGSALADVLLGWSQYALATLVIKFFMGYICFRLMKAFAYKAAGNIFAMVIASLIMVAGYCSFEYLLSGRGGAVAALAPNLIQAAGGVGLGAVLILALDKIKALNPYIAWKANKNNE